MLYHSFFFYHDSRLPEWAEKAIERGGMMEYIANFDFTLYAGNLQLARIASGFLIKDILEHFCQKVYSTLNPDRSLWFYSGHDYSIANALNSLGMYEKVFITTKYGVIFGTLLTEIIMKG